MTIDKTTSTTSTAENDRLLAELAAAQARAKVVAVGTAALGSLAPGVTDAPRGEVTLGAKAGSLAPWLTQQVLAAGAAQIAESVRALQPATASSWRVLITADVNLLNTDVRGQLIQNALTRRTAQLAPFAEAVSAAVGQLGSGLSTSTAQREDFPRRLELAMAAPVPAEGQDDEPEEARAGNKEETAAGEPVEAAVQLVRLVATDYTVTAAEVSADASLLALLTAGALGDESAVTTPGAEPSPASAPAAPAASLPSPGSTADPSNQAAASARKAAEDAERAAAEAKAAATEAAKDVAAEFAAMISTAAKQEGDALQNVVQRAADAMALSARAAAARDRKIDVLLDGFDVAWESRPALTALKGLAEKAEAVSVEALKLQARLAPAVADLADRKTAMETAESEWTKAAVNKDVTQTRLNELRSRRDQLIAEVSHLHALVSPAQAVLEETKAAVEAARADLIAVTTTDDSGTSPIARACAREAIHVPGIDQITHVLYVRPTHTGADVVTRRSILGSSGRVSYLGGANAAWALLEIADGRLVGGGATEQARQLTHDLSTGQTSSVTTITSTEGATLGGDPLAKYDTTIRIAVLALAFGIALLGLLAGLGIALGPILSTIDP
ncbi:MAG TPA: hypothetical protein VF635_11285 [Propionibacteriaceae bacterium]